MNQSFRPEVFCPRRSFFIKKNVPWHILAPSADACDKLQHRASAHHWHVSAFLCNRGFQGISYYTKKHASEIFTSNACLFQKQLLLYIFCIFAKARAVHLSLLYYFLFLRKSGILICVSWRIGRNGCAGADCGASFGATGCAGAAADGARKVGAL